MLQPNTLQTLAEHLDFKFDAEASRVGSSGSGTYIGTAITEVGDLRYADFRVERHARLQFIENPVDGVVEEDLMRRGNHEDEYAEEPNPDDERDKSLHGLLTDDSGYIALYFPGLTRSLRGLYKFQVINGPEGANNAHRALGRTPGVDIPAFGLSGGDKSHFTAGQITEAIADMRLLAPDINGFSLASHDLGYEEIGAHGPSWPHASPAVYRHLSQVAQTVVATHGDGIHDESTRPREVPVIARALDRLIFTLGPGMEDAAIVEQRIRDGRYNDRGDLHIVNDLLRGIYERSAGTRQTSLAAELLALPQGAGESERYRRGYWIGMQLEAGVLAARLALHQERPHPAASDAQTSRTLGILSATKNEMDRRIADNRAYALAA